MTGYFATRDYSYRAKEVAGPGWVLVGDAFGFLDPLYSSGVLLALRSGEMAADAIVEGLKTGDVSAAQLGAWGPAFNDGIDRMRRLVCEYYNGFSFGRVRAAYPDLRGTVTDLLIGDLFTIESGQGLGTDGNAVLLRAHADPRLDGRDVAGAGGQQGQRARAPGRPPALANASPTARGSESAPEGLHG